MSTRSIIEVSSESPVERVGLELPTSREIASFSLLGARVDAIEMEQLNDEIASKVRLGTKSVIANLNLHGLRLFLKDEKLRGFYEQAELVHVDGMSLVILGRLLRLPLRSEHRTAYIDWTPSLMSRAAQEGWRIFYLGAQPGVADKGASILKERWPALIIETHHGHFDHQRQSLENRDVLSRINDFSPHVLMVGMGQPRQEHWIADNLHHIDANVVLHVGACINFFAGTLRTPPRWMGRFGLEWAFRLVTEPRRLWHRYLVEPWALVPKIARELVRSAGSRLRRDQSY